jgi:hypothetical protein
MRAALRHEYCGSPSRDAQITRWSPKPGQTQASTAPKGPRDSDRGVKTCSIAIRGMGASGHTEQPHATATAELQRKVLYALDCPGALQKSHRHNT